MTLPHAGAVFRLDNESLAFRFTATLSDRHGTSLERLTTPARLALWLEANELLLGPVSPDLADLTRARQLREAVHRAGTAIAARRAMRRPDVQILNELSSRGQARRVLDGGRATWSTEGSDPIADALAVVAADAIAVLGGSRSGQVRACENGTCRGLYLDASRGRNRRWCSMNTCGNKAKKAAMRARCED